MRLRTATAVTLAAGLLLAGCGDDTTPASPPVVGTPAASPAKPAPAAPLDAKTVLAKLTAAKLGLTNPAVQNEDTDPNHLFGRPHGYTSRASADLPDGREGADKGDADRGLAIEVFATAADADRRSKYLQELQENMPIMGTEYQYRADGGRVLVRVSGTVKPSLAKKIEAALAGL